MRVLITGAEGFAGSHLVDHSVAMGDEVWGTCRPGARATNLIDRLDSITLRVGDLSQSEFVRGVLREAQFDVLYHLAAVSFVHDGNQDPARDFELNVMSGVRLMDAVRAVSPKTRVVLVSSAEVYGKLPPDKMPITEDQPPTHPANFFAAAKAALELAAFPLVHTYGLPVIIARPFNHTGPRQRSDFVCPSFAEQIAKAETGGEAEMYVGDLKPGRDFTDVRDVARGYRLLATHGIPGEIYNLSSGTSVRIEAVLDMLLGMSRVKIQVRPKPGYKRFSDIQDLRGSNKKVFDATGWKPEIPLEKTLRDLLNWHRESIQSRKSRQHSMSERPQITSFPPEVPPRHVLAAQA